MKYLCLLIAAILTICLGYSDRVAQAQAPLGTLYFLASSEDAYTVTALNPDGSSVSLYSVSTRAQGIVSQLFPKEEVDALNAYLLNYDLRQVESLSELWTTARVDSIIASPDNQQVIAKVVYQTCFVPQNPICFGTTQLVTINSVTQSQQILLNLGTHDSRYLDLDYIDPNPDTQIGQIRWASDNQAAVVEVSYWSTRRNNENSAVVVVPLNGPEPFKIGEGHTWTTVPDGNQIVILSGYSQESPSFTNTFLVVNINIRTGQFTQSSYTLEGYLINAEVGIASYDGLVVFQRTVDTSMLDGGGGLAAFDSQTGQASMVLPNQYFVGIQSTPDAARLILETQDHFLDQAQLLNGSARLQPLVSAPVKHWKLGSRGGLLVQFAKDDDYQVFDPNGTVVEQLDLDEMQQIQAMELSPASTIVAVDW